MTEFLSGSTEETEQYGERLADHLLKSGAVHAFIALYGEMGVGKTAFVRGFARAIGVPAVKSPTYTVVNEYLSGRIPIFHFDMYRLTDEDDLYSIGFEDYLSRKGFVISEWSERLGDALPSDAITVKIQKETEEDRRCISISADLI